ncbi:hypothetical protein CAP31_06815 [Sulfuriferula sp. AH1]|uniref:hypothetical protein n=1 Tax=Sulfuriferula sp. AH1 TaxID=1985873 RepID=UPI000B3B3F36|nr:hypothetical protein [Sulfuriferula sp. AH1]ARU31417.1 hypothetical protein CAP31_06815 [Sulfuriferula sp. AH1]
MHHLLLPGLQTLKQASLYLIPSLIVWLFLKGLSGRTVIYSILSLPGTFLHELLHLVVGGLTNAQPVSFSLLPKQDGNGRLIMGSVRFANVRWYNALPTAVAPLLGLYVTLLVAVYRVDSGYQFKTGDIAIWCLLAPQFSSMWPSLTDWQVSFRSWPIYLVIVALLLFKLDPHLAGLAV